MTEIALFATFWNEIEWVRASLAQIDRIDPAEVIICDGCFDPGYPDHSTDGTREVIEHWVSQHTSRARLISPVRRVTWRHMLHWLRPLPHEHRFSLARLRYLATLWRFHVYRLNQMATFNRMIALSNIFQSGGWFMTYDCDQFYSDAMIAEFQSVGPGHRENMLACREYTFFGDFFRYTDQHERRDYNNMPHRAFADTRFIPTRHPARIVRGRYRVYSEVESKRSAGIVYHYHLKSAARLAAGYSLGDRKPPHESRTQTATFDGEHPSIIREFFL